MPRYSPPPRPSSSRMWVVVLIILIAVGAGWYFRAQLGLNLKSSITTLPPLFSQQVRVSNNLAVFDQDTKASNAAFLRNISFNNGEVVKVSVQEVLPPSVLPGMPIRALSITFENAKGEKIEANSTVTLSVVAEKISDPGLIKLYHLGKKGSETLNIVKADRNLNFWDFTFQPTELPATPLPTGQTGNGLFVLLKLSAAPQAMPVATAPVVGLSPPPMMKSAAPSPARESLREKRLKKSK